jgi:hypothetical protein
MSRFSPSYLFIYLIALSLSSCTTCNNQKRRSTDKLQTSKLVDTTVSCYYTITTKSETKLQANEKDVFANNTSEIGFLYKATGDAAGNSIITITFDKLHTRNSTQDTEQELDAENGAHSVEPAERMLNALKGSNLEFSITKAGDVSAIRGYDTIVRKMRIALKDLTPETKEILEKKLSEMIGDDFIRSNFGEVSKVLPDSAIYVGESWTVQVDNAGGLPFKSTTVYKFSSLDDDVATIEAETPIRHSGNTVLQKPVFGMKNLDAELTGKQKQTITVSAKTGMLIQNQSSMQLGGIVRLAGGKEVPLNMTIEKFIRVKKLDK